MSKVKSIGAPCVVNTKAFIEELSWAARFLETRSTIPILQNVLIEHTAGRIGLTGTDLELAGMTSLAPEHDGAEFSTAVPTKKLIAYLKKVDEPCVRLEVKDFRLTVSHGDASMTVHGMSKESYPVTPEVTPLVAKLAGLKTAIPRAEIAVSADETRFTLNGALLELKKEGPDMLVATTGHVLSMAGVKTDYGKDEVFRALLPRKLLHELWWLEVDQVDFYATDGKDRTVRIDCGNGRQIWARTLTGSFPDYERVIPNSFKHVVALDTARFKKGLERVVLFADERSRAIKLALAGDKVVVRADISETGNAQDTIPAPVAASGFEAGYNADYLLDALRLMPESTEFRANESTTAAQLGTEGWAYTIMPLRI